MTKYLNDTDSQSSAGLPEPRLEPQDKTGSPRPFNIRWVAFGVLVLVCGIGIGNGLVEKLIIDQDSVLKGAAAKVSALEDSSAEDDQAAQDRIQAEKKKLRAAFFGNIPLIASLVFMFFLLPIAVGALIGYRTGLLVESVVAVGAGGAISMIVTENSWMLALVAGLCFSLLGWLSAYGGRRLGAARR